MRHDWQRNHSKPHPKSPWGLHFMQERFCKNCGKWQRLESTYNVMDGHKYYWWPLAGRCKPIPNSSTETPV